MKVSCICAVVCYSHFFPPAPAQEMGSSTPGMCSQEIEFPLPPGPNLRPWCSSRMERLPMLPILLPLSQFPYCKGSIPRKSSWKVLAPFSIQPTCRVECPPQQTKTLERNYPCHSWLIGHGLRNGRSKLRRPGTITPTSDPCIKKGQHPERSKLLFLPPNAEQ